MKNNHLSNFITIDLEEWFMANYDGMDFMKYRSMSSRIDYQVNTLLELFLKNNVKATFFVVGEFATNHQYLIREIVNKGHEIASHSFAHELIYNLTPIQFRNDLRNSVDALQSITGIQVIGFRAPSWSVREETLPWFYEILEAEGFKYSSSVFPAKTFLYGIEGFPERIHLPLIDGKQTSIIEVPQALCGFGRFRTGFGGGFYLRALPYIVIKHCLSMQNNRGNPVFLYLHPREIDPHENRLELGRKEAWIHYYGIHSCLKKFTRLIENSTVKFQRIDHYLGFDT